MRLIIPLLIFLGPTFAFSASLAGSTPMMTLLVSQASMTQAQAKSQLAQMGIERSVNRLIDFAAQGDQNTVTLLLAAGISPSASDHERRVTALHNAASQGHVELVRLLLSMKVELDARDWQGATPLVYAAYIVSVLAPLYAAAGAVLNYAPLQFLVTAVVTAPVSAFHDWSESMREAEIVLNAWKTQSASLAWTRILLARHTKHKTRPTRGALSMAVTEVLSYLYVAEERLCSNRI